MVRLEFLILLIFYYEVFMIISLDVFVCILYFWYLKVLLCCYKGEDYGGLKLRKNV